MKEKILQVVEKSGKSGVLQCDLTRIYGFSKSTVSTVLKELEASGEIVRRRVAGKSYRIWGIMNSPFSVKGVLRVGILKAIEYPSILLTRETCKNIRIHIKIYNSAFSLTKDLAEGYLDAGCSPLITQTLFALVYRTIRINAGCGYNGGGIIFRRNAKIFGSSELSTMEYNLRRYMERENIEGEIRYFSSPQKMMRALSTGDVDAIAIWEPYLTKLSKKYRSMRFEDVFGDYPCCTLASNKRVGDTNEFRVFMDCYKSSFGEIENRREELIEMEARMFQLPKRDVREAFNGFKYSYKLSLEDALSLLQEFGLHLGNEITKEIFHLL